jgi:hypothetical protein
LEFVRVVRNRFTGCAAIAAWLNKWNVDVLWEKIVTKNDHFVAKRHFDVGLL